MHNTENKGDFGFTIKISIANTLGYWMCTIPPMIIDPRLAHTPNQAVRHYPYAWLIFPIGLALGVVTCFVMTRTQRCRRVLWDGLVFSLASILSLPLFLPAFPHSYVWPVSVLLLLLSVLTVWIHNELIEVEYASDKKIARDARLERVKEEILFWKEGMFAIIAAYLALLVSWFNILHELNLQVTSDRGEQLLLNSVSVILVSTISVWVVFGPLAEGAKKRREAQNLLLKIEV